jgi:outer membrane murein-binding lipoprotein Lpp
VSGETFEEEKMMAYRQPRTFLNILLGAAFVMGLTGCDYWPPALQAQIEQLRSEAQTLAIEKTQLQTQLSDLARSKQDLQSQIDDLSRMNREKTGMITSLQNQVDALRAKAIKAMAPKPAVRTVAKPATKPATKPPVKKKPTTHKK